ncbi:ATPase [Jannaschia pagri]|uniref:ATPase n=1 Tax=Jannaschia pagri TaxID=2829797 RepID=A0ABQ4NHA0_9RHOB|nr:MULTISPECIES: ATP12 family protein [unclassified Jannaschia]GIT90310.1 ATPase [Jannaschia sp. AI_61]GIT93584.1 ATPase [Jannaschia sp. AI_62]
MTEWKARRFWTAANVVAEDTGGYAVRLDDKPVLSPLKTRLVTPTQALADGVAAEWDAQVEVIDPTSMPLTRAVNATLDKVIPQRAAVVANLAEYGGSDLLCYRADGPEALVAQQNEAWDPMLAWLDRTHGVRLVSTCGVIPVDQCSDGLALLHAVVDEYSAWELTAFSEFVTLSGSLVLAIAVMDGAVPRDVAWAKSRVDEMWQTSQWGEDEEEAALVAMKKASFLQAGTYLDLVRGG